MLNRASNHLNNEPNQAIVYIDSSLEIIKSKIANTNNPTEIDKPLIHQYVRAKILKGIFYKEFCSKFSQ